MIDEGKDAWKNQIDLIMNKWMDGLVYTEFIDRWINILTDG